MESRQRTGIWGLGTLAAVLGVFVAAPLIHRTSASAAVDDRLGELDLRLARLERRLSGLNDATRDAGPRLEPSTRARRTAAPDADAALPAADARSAPPADEAGAMPLEPPNAEETTALFTLLESYLAQRASPEEQERLFATLRDGHTVSALLADLEAEVQADPDDLATRMQLASAYLAKLFTVPAGPEMGVWGSKAEAQWKAVLSRDDHHWDARYRLGTSYAYYPDVANKTGHAIREFETLRRQQESGPPEARQADVYTILAALHRRQGNTERADFVLEAGRLRHPDAPSLSDSSEGR